MFQWENKPLTFKLLRSKGYGRLEDEGSSKKKKKTEMVRHGSPNRFPALWDSKQITRISLGAKPSSVSRHLPAVPWPRPLLTAGFQASLANG